MFTVDFEKFRHNLKNARSVKGLSAKELSKEAGLRQLKRISDIEDGRGSPSIDEVHSICVVLGQPIDEMLHLKSEVALKWNTILATRQ